MLRRRSFLSWFSSSALLAQNTDGFAAARERMVSEQLVPRGISNAAVLRAMRATPRHEFVPAGIRERAYNDHPLPIGHQATISQPFVVALMTQLLQLKETHRVLEIGTGSGYQAAILAQLTKHVYTIELVPELADSARSVLTRLKYANVTVRAGDGYKGWPEEAPFDRIIVTAAPPQMPQALVTQLANGGRLVAPVGDAGGQELVVIEKDAKGATRKWNAGGVMFVPMRPGK